MKLTISKCLACAVVAAIANQAFAQGAAVHLECRVNLSALGGETITVRITREKQGKLQAQINGTVSNPDVKAAEYAIREKLNLKPDPYGPDYQNYNFAEMSLAHLHLLMEDKELGPLAPKLTFDPRQIRKMKIYDLQGKQDKYGGTVLMEAYRADGKFLGRVYRSIFVSECV